MRKTCKSLLMLSILVCITMSFAIKSTIGNPVRKDGRPGESFIAIISFYDNCKDCCLKDPAHPAYGITASGERARRGHVACNWLPFGTVLEVEGLGIFTVKDRGAKSLFGTHRKPVKRIDVWVDSHTKARKSGKQVRRVVVLKTP